MQLYFDFDRVAVMPVSVPHARPVPPAALPSSRDQRRMRGATAYHSGRLAEAAVADRYRAAGYQLLYERWRGKAGEIDLILRRGDQFIFVEVKSSRDFARAAERINRRQMDRICLAACEFCGELPTGLMTDMRLDAALVDRYGRIEIIENAFGEG